MPHAINNGIHIQENFLQMSVQEAPERSKRLNLIVLSHCTTHAFISESFHNILSVQLCTRLNEIKTIKLHLVSAFFTNKRHTVC